jgi:hypothetical protein
LEGKGREGKAKKEETREVWEGRSLKGYFFFITQKLPNFGELKNCIRWSLEGLCNN